MVDFESDAVPGLINYAICETAIRELAKPGSLKPDYVTGERVVSKTLDVMSKTYAGVKTPDAMLPVFSTLEGLLAGYAIATRTALRPVRTWWLAT